MSLKVGSRCQASHDKRRQSQGKKRVHAQPHDPSDHKNKTDYEKEKGEIMAKQSVEKRRAKSSNCNLPKNRHPVIQVVRRAHDWKPAEARNQGWFP